MDSEATNVWLNTNFSALHELAEHYGTPYFLYDADEIVRRIELVRSSFEGTVDVFYAVKANPNLALLQAVREVADGLDISSVGELSQALVAGYDAATMSFAGPAKSAGELAAAIQHGVGCISVESPRELDECIRIARETGRRANVSLRVNPLLLNRAFGIKMGGRPVQFGIDEEEISAVLPQIEANLGALNFKGIHVYAGSQCFEEAGIVAGVEHTLSIARRIETESGMTCSVINLGGGFGLSHTQLGHELKVEALGKELRPTLRAFREASKGECKIVFELGRYLTADAGIYVTRVIGSKESRGKTFFMADGGLHHHLAAAGTFGAAFRANFLLRNLSDPTSPVVKCSIAGPSCNPTDLLAVDIELSQPKIGDLIGVLKSGSYGLTASPILFLGRPTPVELIRQNSEIRLGRASKTILDFN